MQFKNYKFLTLLITFLFISQCGIYKKIDTRKTPINAQERARQAVEEGRGLGIKNILGGGNKGFEFSSSNPLWRASLETLDFIPLINVDYAGGIIITDWYSIESNNESLKISLQFLSNEIRSDSIKVNVYKKICRSNNNCVVKQSDSKKIKEELKISILKLAALKEKQDKIKK